MVVALSVTTDGRVEVTGYISSERHGARGPVTFVVDTGSQRTILGARDAEQLRFPTGGFSSYTGPPLVGVGGKGRPLSVGPCQIVLGDAEIVGSVEVLYFAPQKETRTRSRAAGPRLERRERSFVVPSLLGTDVLRANRCVLEVDYFRLTGEIRSSE